MRHEIPGGPSPASGASARFVRVELEEALQRPRRPQDPRPLLPGRRHHRLGSGPTPCLPPWTGCSPTSSPKEPARAWNPPGPAAGPAAANPDDRPAGRVARGMYDQTGADGRQNTPSPRSSNLRRVRKTIYRHLGPSGGRRQPGKSARPAAPPGRWPLTPPPCSTRPSGVAEYAPLRRSTAPWADQTG
jgi:hypothetical protein